MGAVDKALHIMFTTIIKEQCCLKYKQHNDLYNQQKQEIYIVRHPTVAEFSKLLNEWHAFKINKS